MPGYHSVHKEVRGQSGTVDSLPFLCGPHNLVLGLGDKGLYLENHLTGSASENIRAFMLVCFVEEHIY